MTMTATLEPTGLESATEIGAYGYGDLVPNAHVTDRVLIIAAERMETPRISADQAVPAKPGV